MPTPSTTPHAPTPLFSTEDAKPAHHSSVLTRTGEGPRVTARTKQWEYALTIPLREPALANRVGDGMARREPAVLSVDLIVHEGGIGVGVLSQSLQAFLDETFLEKAGLEETGGHVRCELLVDDLAACGELVIRNAGLADSKIDVTIRSVTATPLAIRVQEENEKILHAFYDLNRSPTSFDFTYYLMSAEIARHDAGLEAIHVVFIPQNSDSLRYLPAGYDHVVDHDARWWRLHNLAIPMLNLFPSVKGYTLATTRHQGLAMETAVRHVFPGPLPPGTVPAHAPYVHVNSALRAGQPYLRPRASEQGLRFIRQWMDATVGGRKLVTITLRQYGYYGRERNSNLANWSDFARRLDPDVYFPVIVPDTDECFREPPKELDGLPFFREASLNLNLRMALYESAYMNLMTTGGAPCLVYLSERCRYLVIKIIVPSVPFCTEQHQRDLGYTVGGNTPYANPFQKMVWEDDTLDVIEREFTTMARAIEAAG